MSTHRSCFLILAVALCLSSPCLGEDGATFTVQKWLSTDVVILPQAVIEADTSFVAVTEALNHHPIDAFEFWPARDHRVTVAPGRELRFKSVGDLNFDLPKKDGAHLAYAATYLDVDRWTEARIEVTSQAAFKLFVDGEQKLDRAAGADSTATEKATVVLDQGHGRLLLVTAADNAKALAEWSFKVTVTPLGDTEAQMTATTDPLHGFNFQDYYRQEGLGSLDLSPDGKLVLARRTLRDRRDDRTAAWLEIRDIKTQKTIWQYRHGKGFSSTAWAPDSKSLLLVVPGRKGSDLLLWNSKDFSLTVLTEGLEDASGYTWSPDGKGLYYVKTSRFEADETIPYKVMWGVEDRWGNWRDDNEVYFLGINGATQLRLTKGRFGSDNVQASPDGKQLLVTHFVPRDSRPWATTQFWTISTETGNAVLAGDFESTGVSHATWSPDSKFVAFDGPMHQVLGNDSPNPDHNDTQTDLWTLEISTGKFVNHTREFEPAVAMGAYGIGFGGNIVWHEDGNIIFTALHDKQIKLYRFDPKSGEMSAHDLGDRVIGDVTSSSTVDVSTDGGTSTVVFMNSTAKQPGDVYWYDWKKKRGGSLFERNEEMKRLVDFDAIQITEYDYINSDGVTIPGFLYYPAGYDKDGSYPLIIDFYAGVFGFANGWTWSAQVAANRGYFVYVPSPRGASGWGQEFADTHANDWGILTSRDMNEGVRHIVANVPGVDGARCAPVSGSYGGFMTMYLLSQPKDNPDFYPYATGISDYGISNLASYWGIGNWGAYYSDMATARKFPWTDPQYYIDHSPLYFADNITVPLFLMHGDGDVNVPVGESEQMYTALKILGREVEFVRYPGEDHGMASTRKKYLSSKRMHIEWFDRWLKDQPGAWDKRMENEKKR